MESWITRIVAALCAMGSTGLFWTLGVFASVPWRQGRMFELDRTELQVIGVPLVVGVAVAWGALHIFAIADREANPRIYAAMRIMLIFASIAAITSGAFWTHSRGG